MNSPVMWCLRCAARWKPTILMTPYVAPRLGQFFEDAHQLVDRSETVFCRWAAFWRASRVGVDSARSPPRRFGPKLQVLFALLRVPS